MIMVLLGVGLIVAFICWDTWCAGRRFSRPQEADERLLYRQGFIAGVRHVLEHDGRSLRLASPEQDEFEAAKGIPNCNCVYRYSWNREATWHIQDCPVFEAVFKYALGDVLALQYALLESGFLASSTRGSVDDMASSPESGLTAWDDPFAQRWTFTGALKLAATSLDWNVPDVYERLRNCRAYVGQGTWTQWDGYRSFRQEDALSVVEDALGAVHVWDDLFDPVR